MIKIEIIYFKIVILCLPMQFKPSVCLPLRPDIVLEMKPSLNNYLPMMFNLNYTILILL